MKKVKLISLMSVIVLLSSCNSITSTFNTASTTSTMPIVTNDLKMEVAKNVNTITELYAAGKSKVGSEGEEIARNKAEVLAKDALRKAIRSEAYKDIRQKLDVANLKTGDFSDYSVNNYANEIAVKLLNESEKRAEFQTGNTEIGVIYVLSKDRVKEETDDFFQEKLQGEIDRLQNIKTTN